MAKFPPNRVRLLRDEADLTQEQLAEACGTSHSTIQRIESRKRGLTGDWTIKISRALGRHPGELFEALPKDQESPRFSPGRPGFAQTPIPDTPATTARPEPPTSFDDKALLIQVTDDLYRLYREPGSPELNPGELAGLAYDLCQEILAAIAAGAVRQKAIKNQIASQRRWLAKQRAESLRPPPRKSISVAE